MSGSVGKGGTAGPSPFYRVIPVAEARERLWQALGVRPDGEFGALGMSAASGADGWSGALSRRPEAVNLAEALGRILAEDVVAGADIPGFRRSSVDGYAVRSRDAFGASDSLPAFFDVVGEVRMGERATVLVGQGRAVYVPTGGMLPDGADSVVMIEHTQAAGQNAVEVVKPVAPLANVVEASEDVAEGTLLLRAGRRLRAQDLGALAALGRTGVRVFARPRVGIISTGDEIVPVESALEPGKVRDVNTYSLGAAVAAAGGVPVARGVIPDRLEDLSRAAASLIGEVDVLVISGGSSVGERDHAARVLSGLGEPGIIVHGVNIRPGRPTIIGVANGKPIFGLPGHPVSAIVTFSLFVKPAIDLLSGWTARPADAWPRRVEAVLAANVPSEIGREDFVRVAVAPVAPAVSPAQAVPPAPAVEPGWEATPIFGKSGLISNMVRADGILAVPAQSEGFKRGERVIIELF